MKRALAFVRKHWRKFVLVLPLLVAVWATLSVLSARRRAEERVRLLVARLSLIEQQRAKAVKAVEAESVVKAAEVNASYGALKERVEVEAKQASRAAEMARKDFARKINEVWGYPQN